MSLYQSGPHTPRPKPPAQARRGNAADKLLAELALPPPYTSAQNTPERGIDPEDAAFSFPVSSPVTATAQLLGLPVTTRRQVAMSMSHGVSHQSREELKKLLMQTELLIQDRERDLTVAATVGKALLDTNLMLKTKHDALLARLPSTPTDTVRTHSRTASRVNELWATDDEQVVGSPSLAIASPSTPDGHSRRISATPQALAFLQEQNEQLLSQLTQIESEASEASNVGKIKLRQLEKEIGGLRAELDASRERAGELEQTMERQRNEEQRLKLRREEREERAQASRNQRLRAATTDSNAPVQDFAPSSRPPRRPNVFGMNTPDRESSDHETERDVFGPVNDNGGSDLVEAALKHNDGKRGSDDGLETDFGPAPNSQEYDIITQLLSKIAELEGANRDIVSQAARTNERLDKAEKDANSIRRIYEGLEKEIEPISEEDEPGTVRIRGARRASSARRGENLSPTESTHSRKRTNSGASLRPKLSASSLRSPPRGTRGAGNKAVSFNNRLKARKPLSQGLFAPPSSITPRASRDRLGKLARDHRLVDFPEEQGGHSRTPSTSSAIINPTSGISSIASSISRVAGNSGTALRTLGSELGEEFGADWGQGGTSHFITDDEGELAEAEEEHEQGGSMTPVPPRTTGPNPAMAALQSAVEGQGRLLEQDEHIVPLGGLRGAPGEAFFLLAKAVASRPNRWIESDDPQETPARQRTISTIAHRQSALAHHQYQVMSARKQAKSAAIREDPWEANKYPDTESDVGGDGDTDVERPSSRPDRRKTRRDLALDRMALTIRTRHHDTSSIPTPPDTESLHSVNEEDGSTAVTTPTPTRKGHLRKTSRSPDEASFEVIEDSEVESAEYDPLAAEQSYGPGALAQKIKRTWSSTLFEVWILLQAVIIIAAFVWTLSKKGPRAVVGAAEKKRY